MMDSLLHWVQSVLTTTPMRWSSLIQFVPAELLSARPAEKEWSAIECFQHLLDAEGAVFPVRIKALLAGQDFPAYDPDSQGTKITTETHPAVLMASFERLRAENLALLKQISPSDLKRSARHAELGMVTLEELLHEWAGHDLMHTVQAERAMMQPFIRGCGPWKSYFIDHIAPSESVQA